MRSIPWLSALAWASVCVLALAYLASLVTSSNPSQQESAAAGQAEGAAVNGDPDRLAAAIADLGTQVADVRSAMGQLQAQSARMEARLAELSDLLNSVTSAIPAPARTDAPAQRRAPPGPPVTVAYLPMPADGFGDTRLEGSPLPVAAVAEPTRSLFAVELARGAHAKELRRRWRALKQSHAPELDALEARLVDGGDGSRRLIAGPFRNAADAALLCVRLKAAAGTCQETIFAGDPI